MFPDFVRIVQLNDGRIVYPIFKNGSTAIFKELGAKEYDLSTISDLDIVDVFIREPYHRFLSGVTTYCADKGLDVEQASSIINDVYFIDNHFSPQLFWIINLHRFTNAKIRINNLSTLPRVTNTDYANAQTGYKDLDQLFKDNSGLKYHIELDCVLYENLMGQTVTFDQIMETLRINYTDLYNQTFGYTKQIMLSLDI